MPGDTEGPGVSVEDLARYGKKFDKALDAVITGSVKECRFSPSGRRIFTVVGSLGDEFIDPDKPYCSCSNFFFKVSSGREPTCYHLLAYQIAVKTGRVQVVEFSDEEYQGYIAATIGDVFAFLERDA